MGEIFPLFEHGFSGISVNGVKVPMINCANGCPMSPLQARLALVAWTNVITLTRPAS
jgi:hypothetical protein